MMSERRISIVAGLACAVPTFALVAFWLAFTLIGGNGFNGRAAEVWMYGQAGAALLAAVGAPVLARWLCAHWLRAGWLKPLAIGIGILAALAAATVLLMSAGALVAIWADSLR